MTETPAAPPPEKGERISSGRTPEEFAIEFGEYMAKAAVRYMSMTREEYRNADILSDRWTALQSAIYEFRKRATKTNAWLGPPPPPAKADDGMREAAKEVSEAFRHEAKSPAEVVRQREALKILRAALAKED